MIKNDHKFIKQAEIARAESHDPTRQVGAVIVSPVGKLLATGTNRPPEVLEMSRSESHDRIQEDPNWKYFIFEHAERNALQNAARMERAVEGATIFVSLFPCADCARAIVSAGIKRVVAPRPVIATEADEKWRQHYQYATEIFQRSNIQLELYEPSEDALIATAQAS